MEKSSRKLVLTAFFIALGFILPFFTGQIPSIGNKLLPMHIPILLCGFVCGWRYGLIAGFITPITRSLIYGMPPMFIAVSMAFELAAYGLIAGFLYQKLAKTKTNLFISLISAMIGGRIVWGIVSYFIYGMNNVPFGLEIFIGGAFINAIPGIIIQIIIIPIIITALEKAKAIENV